VHAICVCACVRACEYSVCVRACDTYKRHTGAGHRGINRSGIVAHDRLPAGRTATSLAPRATSVGGVEWSGVGTLLLFR
jgi:hypothetical protein